jgi:hypothetical protein
LTETTWVAEHPSYDDWTLEYDIVVLRTEVNLVFGDGIRVTNLPVPNFEVTPGHIGHVTGWGDLEFRGNRFPDILQRADVPVLSNAQCQEIYDEENILSQHICAGETGRDACQGKKRWKHILKYKCAAIISFKVIPVVPWFTTTFKWELFHGAMDVHKNGQLSTQEFRNSLDLFLIK